MKCHIFSCKIESARGQYQYLMNTGDACEFSVDVIFEIRATLVNGLKYNDYTSLTFTKTVLDTDVNSFTTYDLLRHFGRIRQWLLRLKIDMCCGNRGVIKWRVDAEFTSLYEADKKTIEVLIEMCTAAIDSLRG